VVIPVIIGTNGKSKRRFKENLEAIPGKYSAFSVQQTAILGTSHIIGKLLQYEI
jgi:hypothetical protein